MTNSCICIAWMYFSSSIDCEVSKTKHLRQAVQLGLIIIRLCHHGCVVKVVCTYTSSQCMRFVYSRSCLDIPAFCPISMNERARGENSMNWRARCENSEISPDVRISKTDISSTHYVWALNSRGRSKLIFAEVGEKSA